MKGHVAYQQEIPFKDLGGGVSRRVLSHNEQLMTVEVAFEQGSVGAVHTQYGIAIIIILIYHGADGALKDLHFHLLQINPLASVCFSLVYNIFAQKKRPFPES